MPNGEPNQASTSKQPFDQAVGAAGTSTQPVTEPAGLEPTPRGIEFLNACTKGLGQLEHDLLLELRKFRDEEGVPRVPVERLFAHLTESMVGTWFDGDPLPFLRAALAGLIEKGFVEQAPPDITIPFGTFEWLAEKQLMVVLTPRGEHAIADYKPYPGSWVVAYQPGSRTKEPAEARSNDNPAGLQAPSDQGQPPAPALAKNPAARPAAASIASGASQGAAAKEEKQPSPTPAPAGAAAANTQPTLAPAEALPAKGLAPAQVPAQEPTARPVDPAGAAPEPGRAHQPDVSMRKYAKDLGFRGDEATKFIDRLEKRIKAGEGTLKPTQPGKKAAKGQSSRPALWPRALLEKYSSGEKRES